MNVIPHNLYTSPRYTHIHTLLTLFFSQPEVQLRLRQIVPPWGRLFTGMLRFRVIEDAGPYDYEKEITDAEHVFTFKLHSKVRK